MASSEIDSERTSTDVLIADDDPIFRKLAGKAISALGFRGVEATDGAKALELLSHSALRLAIVDLQMPNVDGFALIRCMRSNPKTCHIPIIVVTSRTDRAALEQALEAGATSFVTKPVHWPTFGDQVRYLMHLSRMTERQRARTACAEAASRLKDAAISQAVASSLEITRRIRLLAAEAEAGARTGDHEGHVSVTGDWLAEILHDANQLEDALVGAHDLARRLSQRLTPLERHESVREVVSRAIDMVADAAQRRNLDIRLEVEPGDIGLACHPEAIVDALAQVLLNSVMVAPAGDAVVVEVKVFDDDMLTISITDEGPGMDPDFFAACMSPLVGGTDVPVDAAGTQCEGIAYVKAVAEAHGGSLEVRSMPGQGASVMIVIPAERISVSRERAA